MKLAVAERPIQRIGVTSESTFGVKANGKAFKILSSNLYRDKILAIVRELSCNAHDAHVSVGKTDIPFDIHLPNALEPYLSIRDRGPGLSAENVRTVYTTYFESTKTDSNDFIGTLGLGSKSPFSYVDSYTVISRHEGTRTTYTMFIDEQGCPVVTQMGESVKTDEPDGLEVIIPVDKPSDFREFSDRAAQVLRYFNPRPNVTGNPHFEIKEKRLEIDGDRYRVYSGTGSSLAIMGNIAYPISVSSIPDLTRKEVQIIASNIEIDFPIGSLEFTAGREELSYDQRVTIPNIKKRLVEVTDDLIAVINERFVSCATEYEAKNLWRKLATIHPLGTLISESDAAVWNGKPIRDATISVNTTDIPSIKIEEFCRVYSSRVSSRMVHPYEKSFQFVVGDGLHIYLNDLPRGGIARVRNHVKNTAQTILLVSLDEAEEAEFKKVMKQRGVPLHVTSSLTKPDRTPRQPVKIEKITATGFSYGLNKDSALEPAEVDFNKGGIYLLTSRKNPINAKGLSFYDILQMTKRHGVLDTNKEVFVVPLALKKKFIQSDKWVEWFDYMKPLVETCINGDLLSRFSSFNKLESSGVAKYSRFDNIKKYLPHNHLICEFLREYEADKAILSKAHDLPSLAAAFAIEIDEKPSRLLELWEEIGKKYPLTHWVRRKIGYYEMTDEFLEMISANIKQVDCANSNGWGTKISSHKASDSL